jgi:alkanesulfonate monooxygenase SsuD/methylene tetrahydromethanopterin reductase-like flavin-dependent oxidoreductase (luciferase family)
MKFGISFLPDCDPAVRSAREYYRATLALAVLADETGLDTVKITEHYLHPYGGYCPNPLTFLAAVAVQTKHVRLMTGGIVAAFHHPIQLASEIAMVDNLSDGRLDIGFVRGYLPYEFDALGISMEQSRERYTAVIEAVDRLLVEAGVSITTPFFAFEEATILPRSLQTPRPPIWCAGNTSSEGFIWAGQHQYDLMTVFTFQPIEALSAKLQLYRNEHPAGKVTVFVPLLLDHNHQRAVELGANYLDRYHSVWAAAVESWANRRSPQYSMYEQFPAFLRQADYRFMERIGSVFFGCPAAIVEKIQWLTHHLQPDQILWNLDIGGMPYEIAQNTVRLFVEHVRPLLGNKSLQ